MSNIQKNKSNKKYLIKNLKTDSHILCYNIKDNNFLLINKNTHILNEDFIYKYELEYIKENTYYLIYIHKNKTHKQEITFVFSSNTLDNPLFFNIIIKQNTYYKRLKSNCKHVICTTHVLPIDKLNDLTNLKFINKSLYIFYLTHETLEPCRIKLYNRDFNVFGYNKAPIINKDLKSSNKTTCIYNPDLQNSWKVKKTKSCNHITFANNTFNTKLNKCSMNTKGEYLLNKIPSVPEIFKYYVANKQKIKAGELEDKINENEKNIDKKIGDKYTKEKVKETKSGLSNAYKIVLGQTLEDYSNFLNDTSTSDKLDKTAETTKYIAILDEIKERSKEYLLAKKYKVCSGKPIDYHCNVKNLVKCQNKCNENYDCAYVSYNRVNNLCKLFTTCKYKDKYEYDTYAKRSLLRSGGYNIYNSLLLHRNPPIPKISPYFRGFVLLISVFIIICLVAILYKLIKSLIKFFMCFYYDTCHYPLEILNPFKDGMPNKRYI